MLVYLDSETVTGDFSRELDEAVREVKASEERRHEYAMMQIRDMEIAARAEAKGRQEGREEGRQEGRFEALLDLVKKGLLSIAAAAKEAGMSEADFSKKMQAV